MVKEYGYEYNAVLDKEIYKTTKGRVTHEKFMGAICLRSGRDALKAVAREFKSTTVLIPALACDSMILPFEMYGHKVKYYKLNNDYSINLESLYSLISNEDQTVLFLYMDYFGNKAIADAELEKLRALYPSFVFIEDRTHNLLVESKYTFKPDFTVASLRKWIDIPDGGLLWTDRDLKGKEYSEDLTFSEIRLKAQCMRNEFLQSGNEEIKAEYRKIFSTVADVIDEEKLPGLMSQYSYERACKTDLREVNELRCRNAQVLIDNLQDFDFVQDKTGFGDVYVAVLINNRDAVQKALASMSIFCTIIWPLNKEQRMSCEVAKYTEEHMLTIYCDQRHSVEDMKYIASCIRRVCNE
ncbi:hypothetical protein BRYFOR_09351 [Marvinbryantia formatexigens DSM 14469]|uniref:DegT/DnrJ/EryC1/StrS aminotransferase family protein n=1 Tax=Marvinbryantia formatexigens DSM 14469 TaxID=478749 RepID=C6LL04_9FIRM|nr:hypothetical protein [Marvinbryantia formatexigens]EET58752.1 hypothetical protein BRYFOR_09351 [Marvinbryantia formatexigens DSM 14469]UWO25188.1 hypothetical protein NQ534_01465 [Marvinbryantia formatexigens DSM 14469]SDH08197.1 hypothetical protein SAMN05660368_03801 [Marvinbryantia formatexigens]